MEYENEISKLKNKNKKIEKENKELEKFKDKFTCKRTLYTEKIENIILYLRSDGFIIREIVKLTDTSIGTIYRVKEGKLKLRIIHIWAKNMILIDNR